MAYPEFTPEELASEQWRDVIDFPGYQVSNLGRVRRVRVTILKPNSWGTDYARLTLYRGKQRDKDFKSFGVHQLVARAFIGPKPDGHIPNHEDGNKWNNRTSNLAYKTHSENTQHAYDTGLAKPGEGIGTSKLTAMQVEEIIRRLAAGEANKVIARDYPVSESVIGFIRKGKSWKHLPRPAGLSDERLHWSKRMPQYLARGSNNGSRKKYEHIPKGEDSHNAKLTEQDVKAIRELHGKHSMRELADKFHVGKSQIKRIIDRATWKHVP